MREFLIRVLCVIAGLWVATHLIPGIHIEGTSTFILAAVLLIVVNALIRPVAILLTLPLTLLTLGLFIFVINAAMFGLVAALLDGMTVSGFFSALFGAIVVGLVSLAGMSLLGADERR
ncbi:phage holin family protein [Pedomonas sp. V897]|uniref:phage holin family protein n=1 Tax=Pedomonas sp. V897 TaxID=3446482 RepID=UPI003EDFF912